jgi:hypothetical protein
MLKYKIIFAKRFSLIQIREELSRAYCIISDFRINSKTEEVVIWASVDHLNQKRFADALALLESDATVMPAATRGK